MQLPNYRQLPIYTELSSDQTTEPENQWAGPSANPRYQQRENKEILEVHLSYKSYKGEKPQGQKIKISSDWRFQGAGRKVAIAVMMIYALDIPGDVVIKIMQEHLRMKTFQFVSELLFAKRPSHIMLQELTEQQKENLDNAMALLITNGIGTIHFSSLSKRERQYIHARASHFRLQTANLPENTGLSKKQASNALKDMRLSTLEEITLEEINPPLSEELSSKLQKYLQKLSTGAETKLRIALPDPWLGVKISKRHKDVEDAPSPEGRAAQRRKIMS